MCSCSACPVFCCTLHIGPIVDVRPPPTSHDPVSARCLRKTNSSLDVTVQLIALYLPLRLSYSVMNDTVSSCFSTLVPTSCFQWMYTSSPSSSSVMKPNLLSLNHLFTRPASDLAAPMKGIWVSAQLSKMFIARGMDMHFWSGRRHYYVLHHLRHNKTLRTKID